MKRRELRENIMKIIFRLEFHPIEEIEEQANLYLDIIEELKSEDRVYIKNKVLALIENIEIIDKTIEEISVGWKLERMGKSELAIIRLAVYEIQYDEDIPVSVAINEAVELAKIYGNDEKGRFVNGVLAKLAK